MVGGQWTSSNEKKQHKRIHTHVHTHIIGCQEQESKKRRRQGKRKGSWGRHQWGWRRFRTHCHQFTSMRWEVFSRISLIRVGREYLTIGYQLCFFLSLSMALTGSSLTLLCLLTLKFQADLTGFCRNTICCEKSFFLQQIKLLFEMLQQDWQKWCLLSEIPSFHLHICCYNHFCLPICLSGSMVHWNSLIYQCCNQKEHHNTTNLQTCIEFVLIKMFWICPRSRWKFW